jgi:hypothetical protein
VNVRAALNTPRARPAVIPVDNDDVYLNKLQTRGVKKSILYM